MYSCTCSIGEYNGRLIFIHFPQNGKVLSDEKPFREPQFPRLPVSYLATRTLVRMSAH